MGALISAIGVISLALRLIILIDIVIRYFVDPFHPVRSALDAIVEPMLAPIRKIIPPIGGTFDLSPIILLILISVLETVLINLLVSLG